MGWLMEGGLFPTVGSLCPIWGGWMRQSPVWGTPSAEVMPLVGGTTPILRGTLYPQLKAHHPPQEDARLGREGQHPQFGGWGEGNSPPPLGHTCFRG